MGKIGLIIGREYFSRVKKKSFLIMTILGPILIVGLFVGAVMLSLSEDSVHNVLVVDDTTVVADSLKNTSSISFVKSNEDLTSSKATFREAPYTMLLWIPENGISSNAAKIFYEKYPSLISQKAVGRQLERVFELYKLREGNISYDDFRRIKTTVHIGTIDIEKGNDSEDKGKAEAGFIGFAFAVIIYMFIFLYGVQVMRGVIEEKTNRVVEVIISSVKPFQLMMGKIVGVALVGLTQFALWIILTSVAITFIATMFPDKFSAADAVEMQQMSTQMMQEEVIQEIAKNDDASEIIDLVFNRINFPLMLGLFLFYFLGGYLLYGALFAAVGGAVDSEVDTQQFMLPITIPLVFGFIVSQFAVQNPEGPAAFWFSIIPFTSPIVMMVRVAVGMEGNGWQLILSMVLLVLGFIFTTWIAGRIYRTGILMYGKKVTYKELWKWLRYRG